MSDLMNALIAAKLMGNGGGGGGGGLEHVWATLTYEDPAEEGDDPVPVYTLNKTYAELKAIADAGKLIYFDGYYYPVDDDVTFKDEPIGYMTVGEYNEFRQEYYAWVNAYGGNSSDAGIRNAIGFKRIVFTSSTVNNDLKAEVDLSKATYTLTGFQGFGADSLYAIWLEPVGDHNWDVVISTIRGRASVSLHIAEDAEVHDLYLEFGDFHYDPDGEAFPYFDETAVSILIANRLNEQASFYDGQNNLINKSLAKHLYDLDDASVGFTL